jgi:hypothetical protein
LRGYGNCRIPSHTFNRQHHYGAQVAPLKQKATEFAALWLFYFHPLQHKEIEHDRDFKAFTPNPQGVKTHEYLQNYFDNRLHRCGGLGVPTARSIERHQVTMKKLIYPAIAALLTACSTMKPPIVPPPSCPAPQQGYLPKEAVSCECVGAGLWSCKIVKEVDDELIA